MDKDPGSYSVVIAKDSDSELSPCGSQLKSMMPQEGS